MAETTVPAARGTAQRFVEPLGRRWRHVQGVAASAERVALECGLEPLVLVASAWLHDIGYSPELQISGFHPVDGARFLRSQGIDERVVRLVAHHSQAVVEARERGIEHEFLEELPFPPSEYADALCFCDMTNGPGGDPVSVDERLDEIQERYGPGHVVTKFVEAARPEILAAVGRVEERMRVSGSQTSSR